MKRNFKYISHYYSICRQCGNIKKTNGVSNIIRKDHMAETTGLCKKCYLNMIDKNNHSNYFIKCDACKQFRAFKSISIIKTLKYNTCKKCLMNNKKNIKIVVSFFKSNGCAICGYDKCNTALQFHHVMPNIKIKEISDINKLEILIIELNKCILLCANCHCEIHQI